MTKIYTKKPLGIQDQIARLKSLGLIISDNSFAEKVLAEVSYFRFASYLRPLEEDKLTHKFKPSSTFENAVALYEFDNSLRQLLFAAIQRYSKRVQPSSTRSFGKLDEKLGITPKLLCTPFKNMESPF